MNRKKWVKLFKRKVRETEKKTKIECDGKKKTRKLA